MVIILILAFYTKSGYHGRPFDSNCFLFFFDIRVEYYIRFT